MLFNLFDEMFNDPFFKRSENLPHTIMKTDVHEKDGFYFLEMELPGYTKEDIKAELKNGYLTITASKTENSEDTGEKVGKGSVIFKERYTGQCSRRFYVGSAIREEDVKAGFENGVLTLVFPSKEPQRVEEKKYISIA